MSDPEFNKVVIHGVGLMGGSLGLALLERNLAKEVWGLGRDELRLKTACDTGVLTHFTTQIHEAAHRADLVVIGLPVRLIHESAVAFSPLLPRSAVITDMGSTKAKLVNDIGPDIEDFDIEYVGSHPMCGSEKSGFEAGRSDLYEGATCVVTPTSLTSPEALSKTTRLWEAVGGRILELDAQEHDRLAARTSHLPRAVAAALCHALEYEMEAEKRDQMVATGFLGMTRTASSEEEMWTQIMGANSDYLIDAIGDFQQTLSTLHDLLAKKDEKGVREWLRAAADIRSGLHQDTDSMNGETG